MKVELTKQEVLDLIALLDYRLQQESDPDYERIIGKLQGVLAVHRSHVAYHVWFNGKYLGWVDSEVHAQGVIKRHQAYLRSLGQKAERKQYTIKSHEHEEVV